MSCGHPTAAIVSSDEGTAYCRWCALEAENARLAAELAGFVRLNDVKAERIRVQELEINALVAQVVIVYKLAARWHKKARPHINGIKHECKELGAWTCIDSCANELDAALAAAPSEKGE